MRTLQTHDVFKALKILEDTGIKNEFQKMALKVANGVELSQQEVGVEMVLNLITGCSNERTENEIYDFLGGLLEVDAASIKTMDVSELLKQLTSLKKIVSSEELKAFFTSLRTLIARK